MVALLENARNAVLGAGGLASKAPSHASDEELVALYKRWRALIDEHAELAGVPVAEETESRHCQSKLA